MPDDKKFDLSSELGGMLDEVKAATQEVKQQQDARVQGDALAIQRVKTRKLQAIIIGVAAAVIFLIAYLVVFAGPGTQQGTPGPANSVSAPATSRGQRTTLNDPAVRAPRTSAQTPASGPVGRDAQVADHPSDDYEQPSSQPGM